MKLRPTLGALLIAAGCAGAQNAPVGVVTTELPEPTEAAPTTATPAVPALPQARSTAIAFGELGSVRVVATGGDSVTTPDFKLVAGLHKSRVVLSDGHSGAELRSISLPEGFGSPLLSPNGSWLAVSDAGTPDARGLPAGRSSTKVLVYDLRGPAPPRELNLRGNVVPEAFSASGDVLYVLNFEPATKPEYYVVRMVDVASGRVSDTYGRLKEPPGQMPGSVAHRAVLAADTSKLFTLYSIPGPEGNAFIHTLHLREQWNHCIDLPLGERFGEGQPTLAIGDDGKQLYAVGAAGQIAEVDARDERLTVSRVVRLDGVPKGRAPVAAVAGDKLVVAYGTATYALDRATLKPVAQWNARAAASLMTADSRHNLVLARDDKVELVDLMTGRQLVATTLSLSDPIEHLAILK